MATENIDNFKAKIQESNASGSGCFQVMIKTLNFGTITLEIEATNTIDIVKKMARLKLDDLTQGLDSELWISNETELICNGKLLEDGKTVSDYNIQKDFTLRMVFGLDGGAKRGRSAVEVADSSGIQTMTSYVMLVSDDDPAVVRDIVGLNIRSTGEWLRKLTLTQLEEVVDKQILYIQYVNTFLQLCETSFYSCKIITINKYKDR
jgi:ubiquitin C